MRAPKRSIENGRLVPFFEDTQKGRVFRQLDDEMLDAFESDCRGGGVKIHSIGSMVARIREAEKDRDYLLAALVLLLPMARSWVMGKHSPHPDNDCVRAAQLLVDELAPESIVEFPEVDE
jgi:hypothetical protein